MTPADILRAARALRARAWLKYVSWESQRAFDAYQACGAAVDSTVDELDWHWAEVKRWDAAETEAYEALRAIEMAEAGR